MRRLALPVATWIISRLVPEGEREPLVGDLTEEYSLRANATSSSAALKWYVRQVCASASPLLWVRFTRAAWLSTIGVALLAYVAVGVVEFTVDWAISNRTATGAFAFKPLGLVIIFPMVVLIAYFAARFRRRAAILLGVMMLLVVTAMTLWAAENMPAWYRVAYFVTGPAAAFIGGALRSLRPTRGAPQLR
jgi:hypothetical protein